MTSSNASIIRCPPYCRVNCAIKHHPLLVVLLNCGDTDDKGMMKERLHNLKHVVLRYEKIDNGKWKKDDPIPDVVESYRFPMIHWACALGRASAVEWLTQHGLDPTMRTKQDEQEETGLHRAILCLQETCPNNTIDKFVQLLPALQGAMFTVDGRGNLPIHTCCELLANEMPKPEFYQGCTSAMISHLKKQENDLLNKLLESENSEGNTALHILCRNDRCFSAVTELIAAGGGSMESKNHKGQTHLDVALTKGQVKLVRYLYDKINPKAAPFTSSATDVSDKARTQHNKRTPKIATRNVYDSKGIVIGSEVKVMLKNNPSGHSSKPSTKRSASADGNSDSESNSGDVSPRKSRCAADAADAPSPGMSRSPGSNTCDSPVPSHVDPTDMLTNPVEEDNMEEEEDSGDDDAMVHATILKTLPPSVQKETIEKMTEKEFFQFLYKAGPEVQQAVLVKFKEEEKKFCKDLGFLKTFESELQSKQEDVTAKQREIVHNIHNLLSKLTKIQKEETRLVTEVQNIEMDLAKTTETRNTIKQRVEHGNQVLQILNSAKEDC